MSIINYAKTFLYILYYRYGDNLGVDKYPIFTLYNICLTQYTLSHCRVLVQRTFRICLIAGTLREAVFVVHSVRQSLTFIILASTSELLYVQEVVTLQKKYQIYLHQKMRFFTIFWLLRYFSLNIISLQSKKILGHMN